MDKIKQNLSGKEFHLKKEDLTRLWDMLNQKDEIKSGPHAQTQSSRLPSPSPDVGTIRSCTDAEQRIEIIDAEEVRVPNQSGLVIEVIIFICSYLEDLSNGLGPNINSITQSERPRRSSQLGKDTDGIIASEDEDGNRLFTAQAAKQVREATGKINLWVDGLQILDGTLDENLPFREELRDALYLTFYTFLSHLQRLSKNTNNSTLLLTGDVDILMEQLSAASPGCRILDEVEGDSDNDASLEQSSNDRYFLDNEETPREYVDFTSIMLNSIIEELDEMIACLSEMTPSLNDLLEEIWEKRYMDKVNTIKAAADAIEYKDLKPEDYLYRNLKDKFPSLSEGLGKRIAIASWQLYGSVQRALRKRERDRLRHNLRLENFELDSTYDSMEPTTIAASMLEYSLDPEGIEASDLFSEGGATSVWFSDRPAIPPPPVDLDDDITFECQFCLKRLEGIRNMKQWRRHIFADIRPYICTFPNCELKGVRWGLRREWIEHEIDFHRRKEIWKCNVNGCSQEASLDSELEFIVKHIILTHSVTFSDFKQAICIKAQYLSRFPKSSSTQLPINDSSPCPFCREPVDNKRAQLERHLGRHLEDIALPVLSLLAEKNFPEPEQEILDIERDSSSDMSFRSLGDMSLRSLGG